MAIDGSGGGDGLSDGGSVGSDDEVLRTDGGPARTDGGPTETDGGSKRFERTGEPLAVSTLFTAQNVRDLLSDETGISDAVEWCRETGVTHVFVETYRNQYRAEREALERARDHFREEGFEVAGCVTPTEVGELSTGWDPISCFTSRVTREELADIFTYTASIFDLIMVDDFLFTDCECERCIAARGGSSWAAYRSELMVEVSRDHILAPARAENPDAEVIIKYPKWYEIFAERGYVVDEQTADYDQIWVGTETRDYDDPEWGGTPQYGAYYLMRWLGAVGGEKTGGGWFDPYGTTPDTYVEQAIQTVLGGVDEMLLFCYGSLLEETGPENVDRLREDLPEILELARLIDGREPYGVPIPKPPNSDPIAEAYVASFLGMLGLPLVPTTELPTDAPAAVATPALLEEGNCSRTLLAALDAGTNLLLTEELARRLRDPGVESHERARVIETDDDPASLLALERDDLAPVREHVLSPLGIEFDAPNRVSLYLFDEEEPLVAIENFDDREVTATLGIDADLSEIMRIPDGAAVNVDRSGEAIDVELAPRSLIVLG